MRTIAERPVRWVHLFSPFFAMVVMLVTAVLAALERNWGLASLCALIFLLAVAIQAVWLASMYRQRHRNSARPHGKL